jgi:putative PIN family toxin of toxin-antitoxin system
MIDVKRVVIDTNVLINASLAHLSVPALCLDWELENSEVIFSPATFNKYLTRLLRPKFSRYFKIGEREFMIRKLRYLFKLITYDIPVVSLCSDPDNNKFLGLALAGGANRLITSDRDLLVVTGVSNLEILTPAQALAQRNML